MAHIPVMLQESLELFKGQKISSFFDGTLGAGGFAKAMLQAHPEIETYYGCDRDESALELARENLRGFEQRVEFVHANFCDVQQVLSYRGKQQVDGFFLIWEYLQCS